MFIFNYNCIIAFLFKFLSCVPCTLSLVLWPYTRPSVFTIRALNYWAAQHDEDSYFIWTNNNDNEDEGEEKEDREEELRPQLEPVPEEDHLEDVDLEDHEDRNRGGGGGGGAAVRGRLGRLQRQGDCCSCS